MHCNPFSDAELARRLDAVRRAIAARELDAVVLSAPENIFYLTGLDHWGYFAPHMLVVPLDGRPVLVTREMERVSVQNMVRTADFRGHADTVSAAETTASVLRDLGLAGRALGLEAWSSGLSCGAGEALKAGLAARWQDVTGLVDRIRQVKSVEEQALMRRAAAATDAGTAAAMAAAVEGAEEREIAAACLAAMVRAGGEPPGFGPFIRPRARLGEEHTTWGEGRIGRGEVVFLEVAGCVARYHTPNGRLVHVDEPSAADREIAEVARAAYRAALGALRPGAHAGAVYDAWQDVVDSAGLAHYRRHHCGYAVGIAFPPSWTGGNSVAGLRHGSDMPIEEGMSFHFMSWLMGCGRGEFFFSNCVLLGPDGPEELTTSPAFARERPVLPPVLADAVLESATAPAL